MNTVEIANQLEKNHHYGVETYKQHDWQGFSQRYSEDAVQLLGNGRRMQGRAAIMQFYAEMDELMAEFGLEVPPEGELLLPPPEDDGGQ